MHQFVAPFVSPGNRDMGTAKLWPHAAYELYEQAPDTFKPGEGALNGFSGYDDYDPQGLDRKVLAERDEGAYEKVAEDLSNRPFFEAQMLFAVSTVLDMLLKWH